MGIGCYPRRTETAVVEVAVIVGSSSENSTEAVQQVRKLVGEPEDEEGPSFTLAIGERVIDRGVSWICLRTSNMLQG